MRRYGILITAILVVSVTVSATLAQQAEINNRRLPVKEYVDKMKAGWVGQMAGVGWGGPTEYQFRGKIMPLDKMPEWKPEMINQFGQDDIYVEMTFLRTLELYGMDVSIRQAGIDFANSGYGLAHANRAGRNLLRMGIAPPDSGHPEFNKHADCIDYQIEADYSGLIAPGLGNVPIELGEKFGRLMNYGDGLYGGQFVGGMYAEAFFENDMEKIIRAGLKCIPQGSQYHECISDVVNWYKQNPDDWQKTWQLINEKYQLNPDYRRFTCKGAKTDYNVDAKINGAFITMGLLYGKGDPDKTIIISTRCGLDSDCNPSSSGGVLFTAIGFEKLPEKFKSALNYEYKFAFSPYNFPNLAKVCEKLARQSVIKAGGRVEKNSKGEDIFVIPVTKPKRGKLQQCWEPGPIAGSLFTEKELTKLQVLAMPMPLSVKRFISEPLAVKRFAPGWSISNCGVWMDPGFYSERHGKKNVLVTYPYPPPKTGCVLSKKVEIGVNKTTTLALSVGHHDRGDWTLIVKADGKELLNTLIGKETANNGWADIEVDLSQYAGKEVRLELINQPDDEWLCEAGYWSNIELVSRSADSSGKTDIPIIYLNQSGFNLNKPKRFTAPTMKDETPFIIKAKDGGKALFSGKINKHIGDFTAFNPVGEEEYVVEAAGETSAAFRIGPYWLERVTYHNAVDFMIDSRHYFGTYYLNTCGNSFGWRDACHYAFEVNTLVAQYLSNPKAYERMDREIVYPSMPSPDRKSHDGRYIRWGALQPYSDDAPDIVKLIHWGTDIIVSMNLRHEMMKEQAAYFLYAWPWINQWLPQQNYEVVSEFAFANWGDPNIYRAYAYNGYRPDFPHGNSIPGGQHNLFEVKTKIGTTKGEMPPGHSVQPNLMMYEVAKRQGRKDAEKYFDAAFAQVEWMITNMDWEDPQMTKGQRMSEHVTMTGLAHFMSQYPKRVPKGLKQKIADWAKVMIRRSENMWDFRKLTDDGDWTPSGPQGTMWNEPGNVVGFPACLLAAGQVIDDPKINDRLEQLAYSHMDNAFGRNPTGRHFCFHAPEEIEGVETGWYSFLGGGVGKLDGARFVIEAAPKREHYPYNPEVGNVGWSEGWVNFNTAFNVSLAYMAHNDTEIELTQLDDKINVRLRAPLNFDYRKDEKIAIWIVSSNGDKEKVTLKETGPYSQDHSGTIPFVFADKKTGDGKLQVDKNGHIEASYGFGYMKKTGRLSMSGIAAAAKEQFILVNVLADRVIDETVFKEVIKAFPDRKPGQKSLGIAGIFSYFRKSQKQIKSEVTQFLALAEKYNMPILIQLDGEQFWEGRPDLWNWWDPTQPGYNPENRNNVEWSGWGPEHALKIAWRNWGRQVRVLPPPNLMSRKYRKACHEEMRIYIPLILQWWKKLPQEKKRLLVGIKFGWESAIGVSSYHYPNGNSLLEQPAENDPVTGIDTDILPGRGVSAIGYAAVKTAKLALSGDLTEKHQVKIVSRHLNDLCALAAKLGVPREKLFTHCGGWKDQELLYDAALNNYSCPGWSCYKHALDPANDKGVQRVVNKSDAPYWAVTEWFIMWQADTETWETAIRNNLADPKCRYLCIYNWCCCGLTNNTAGLDAIRRVLETPK